MELSSATGDSRSPSPAVKKPGYFSGGSMIFKRFKREWPLHLMLLPAVIVTAIFSYGPMYGLIMAFQNYSPVLGFSGSPFVGLENFRWLFNQSQFTRTIPNTFFISLLKIGIGTAASVIFALLLNEIRIAFCKRFFQTIIYIPNFISWIILAGVMHTLLASDGLVNSVLMSAGFSRVPFLSAPRIFPWTMIWSDVWKTFGFGTVVYLATITSIDPALYESAVIDGAGRFKQTLYITLPLMGHNRADGDAGFGQRAERRLRSDLQLILAGGLFHGGYHRYLPFQVGARERAVFPWRRGGADESGGIHGSHVDIPVYRLQSGELQNILRGAAIWLSNPEEKRSSTSVTIYL